MGDRIYYRKEKLRGACWEYEIDGGWITVPSTTGERSLLHHQFTFYRPKEVEVRTETGVERLQRTGADQWFFPDRWYSLLRFRTRNNQTVGYYVNFSLPLTELRKNYYRDVDLELDLWVEPDGTATILDQDEFQLEIDQERLCDDWVRSVNQSLAEVSASVEESIRELGPNLDTQKDPDHGVPHFILTI
jgi:protein associated with RNAse G/E